MRFELWRGSRILLLLDGVEIFFVLVFLDHPGWSFGMHGFVVLALEFSQCGEATSWTCYELVVSWIHDGFSFLRV